jgi:hypothetical protein
VGSHGIQLLHAAEVNALQSAMDGKTTATNNVIPRTRCDLYSYSSWDIGFSPAQLTKALDYLESKAPDNRMFGRYNLLLGEYGMPKNLDAPDGERFEHVRQLMEAALGWGVRYAVYWQVFDNEAAHTYTGRPGNDDLKGFWLVRPDGVQAPIWDDFTRQLKTTLLRVAFSSFSSQYFSASSSGDHAVSAERWIRGGFWETFILKDWKGGALMDGDPVSLQAHDGRYLTVEPGENGKVFATASDAGRPETFVIHKIGGAGPITPGDSIALGPLPRRRARRQGRHPRPALQPRTGGGVPVRGSGMNPHPPAPSPDPSLPPAQGEGEKDNPGSLM